jgi:hypothetical protein
MLQTFRLVSTLAFGIVSETFPQPTSWMNQNSSDKLLKVGQEIEAKPKDGDTEAEDESKTVTMTQYQYDTIQRHSFALDAIGKLMEEDGEPGSDWHSRQRDSGHPGGPAAWTTARWFGLCLLSQKAMQHER